MRLDFQFLLFFSGLLAMAMNACTISKIAQPASVIPVSAVQASQDDSNVDAAAACANPFQPIKLGATWNYKLSGTAPDTFTRSVVSMDEEGFTEQDVFASGVTRQGQWTCDSGNLIALNPAQGGSGSTSAINVALDFQPTELSGVTLPAGIHSGDSWTQTITLEGTERLNGADIPARNQFINTCTANGQETVTVEAGTFEAMRLDCQTDMNITVTMNGEEVQSPISFTSSNWYVENIGLVLTVVTGNGLDGTVELVSFIIP